MIQEELHAELRRWRKIRARAKARARLTASIKPLTAEHREYLQLLRYSDDHRARSARIKVRKLQEQYNAGLKWSDLPPDIEWSGHFHVRAELIPDSDRGRPCSRKLYRIRKIHDPRESE